MRLTATIAAAVAVLVAVAGAQARPAAVKVGGDWARFGYDAARHDSGPAATGITAANVGSLKAQQVALDGTVDSSAVYVRGIRGRDLAIVTTTYGKSEAIDASTGQRVWRFTPPGYASWAGSPQITNATPIVDRAVGAVFAAAPDGRVRRLDLATGRLRWTATVTKLPSREKLTSSLNLTAGRLLVTTGGYIGDAPPYQGHVVSLDEKTGRILAVWNSLCAERTVIQVPSTCPESDSAIWARSGAVVDPATGRLLVATGNAAFDGKRYFGDSVLVLSPDGKQLVASYTPTDFQHLDDTDLDLGSTAPALLAGGYAVQGGKDGKLRLLGPAQLTRAPGSTGGELQIVPTPGGADLFSAPAVWQGTWLFVADGSGTAAWRLTGGRLVKAWENGTSGTSPVVAGGLLYVLSLGGGVDVYRPTTGRLVTTLPTGSAHWQSPIVTDGRVIVAEGNANDHATKGVLDIFRLAGA
ncbi:MAG TPA: PQQ-binding-like beta-propeller repeat protein [Gaiellaceae bacterium]|nr:PQQ-binding-like beta-propeller repeat protein [Gaiellaceae bacterium]